MSVFYLNLQSLIQFIAIICVFCKTERRMRAELITGIKWYLFSNSGLGVSPASRPPWSSMENTLNVYIHPRHRDALIQQIRSIPSCIPSNLLPFLDNFIPVIQSLHSTGKINFKSKIGENAKNLHYTRMCSFF